MNTPISSNLYEEIKKEVAALHKLNGRAPSFLTLPPDGIRELKKSLGVPSNKEIKKVFGLTLQCADFTGLVFRMS